MLTIRWGDVAHQFLGAALALPPVALAWVFVTSWRAPHGTSYAPWLLLLLAAGTAAIVGAVACAPPVRGVEIAAARTLLGLELPDPVAPTAWPCRVRGAAWLSVVAALGALVALGLLVLLPLGFGLLVVPMVGGSFRLPGASEAVTAEPGVPALGWGAAGLASVAAAYALVLLGGRLTRRMAPEFLGPSGADREVLARERERRLARANLLARELHDSVGHALTAMTLQADAARVLLRRDPGAAEAALDAVAERGRAALSGLDQVLGALRDGTDPTPGADLLAELLTAPDVRASGAELLSRLPAPALGDVARMVGEAITNGRRHGIGPIAVRVADEPSPAPHLRIRVENALRAAPDDAAPGGRDGARRGLLGLRERALLLGGSITAGPGRDSAGRPCWVVELAVPR